MGIANDPLSFGSGEFLSFEFPFTYFLEQHGYDVSYCSNSDMVTPERGLGAKAFISVGHDEYWDNRQYDSVKTMRDEGVSLLFFSGNTCCWISPYSKSLNGNPFGRIDKIGPYGGDNLYAVQMQKEKNFPERGPDEGMLLGVRNNRPLNGGGDWNITNPNHWIFDGMNVKKDNKVYDLVGWEFHKDVANIPGLEIVGEGIAWQGGNTPTKWQSILYPGPKNNFVFHGIYNILDSRFK